MFCAKLNYKLVMFCKRQMPCFVNVRRKIRAVKALFLTQTYFDSKISAQKVGIMLVSINFYVMETFLAI